MSASTPITILPPPAAGAALGAALVLDPALAPDGDSFLHAAAHASAATTAHVLTQVFARRAVETGAEAGVDIGRGDIARGERIRGRTLNIAAPGLISSTDTWTGTWTGMAGHY